MRLCLIALFVAALHGQAASAWAQSPAAGQQTLPPVGEAPPPQAPALTGQPSPAGTAQAPPAVKTSPPSVADLPISLDNIRKALDEAPPAPPTLQLGDLPTFRVTVYGQRKPLLPEFSESLKQAWQPVVPGGIHNKEILDMITPPQARPYGAFINSDLLQVAATALANALLQRGAVKGYGVLQAGVRSWREEQIRREVEAELEAFKRANPVPPLPPRDKKAGETKGGESEK